MIDLIPDYLYAFAVPCMMVLVPFIAFIAYWYYHQAIKDWLWHIDEVTTKWLFRLLDKVFGNTEYDRRGKK